VSRFDHPAAEALAAVERALGDFRDANLWSLPTPELGAPISAALARRLACDAKVIPVVLGSNSEPLDVGRATRAWPLGVRRALEARDQGCAFPGCDRPATWCDAHHIVWWVRGGPSSLDNGVLLCRRHHTLVHQDHWHIHLKDGLPWLTPPTWIDPTRTPRQHSRYKKIDDP